MDLPHKPSALRILQSAGAASVTQVWRLGVTFLAFFCIRRMMPPEDLGVWMWAEPVFVLLSITRDLGINGHLIRLEQRPYGNFLAVAVFWGGLFAGAVALGAPWLATFFESHDAQTVQIIRVLALFLWVQGIGLVPLTYFEAEHLLARAIPAELARNAVFAILAVLWVWMDWGVWGVVWAHLSGSVVFTIVLWLGCRSTIRLRFAPREIVGLVRDSLPLALLSLLEQGVLYLDVLVLGLILDKGTVGKVGLATYALFFFSRLLADAMGRAVYPAIVAYSAHPERAFGLYRVATLFLVCCFVPLAFFMHHNAELVAYFLGGSEWTGAAAYLSVAAFIPFVRPLTMFGREYLLVARRDRLLIAYTLTNLLSLGGLGYYLIKFTELRELGMAVAGYFPLGTLFLGFGLWQLAPKRFVRLLWEMISLYLLGALIFAAIWLIPNGSTWTTLATSIVAGLVFLAFAYRRHGDDLRDFLAWT